MVCTRGFRIGGDPCLVCALPPRGLHGAAFPFASLAEPVLGFTLVCPVLSKRMRRSYGRGIASEDPSALWVAFLPHAPMFFLVCTVSARVRVSRARYGGVSVFVSILLPYVFQLQPARGVREKGEGEVLLKCL